MGLHTRNGPQRQASTADGRLVWAKIVIVIAALLALIGADYRPPAGEIRGKVLDAATMGPLGYANIVVVGTSKGAMTLENGEYNVPNVQPGKYLVKAMMMGFATVEDSVEVFADSMVTLDFQLEQTIVAETQVIECLGERKMIEVRSSDVRATVSDEQMSEMPVDNAIDAIRLSTGIVKTGDDLHARGGRSGEIEAQRDATFVDDPLTPEDESKQSAVTYRHERKRKQKKPPPPPTPVPGSEQYAEIQENPFLDPLDKPMSTFSVDVDAASYANVRRFVRMGQLPPPNAVRIEELINYFSYDYPNPSKKRPFSITTEVAACPWDDKNKLVHIGLQGRRVPVDELPPANLVFLIDVSGSMAPPNKLPLLKSAFRMLTENLRDDDRVAITCYAGTAGVALQSTTGSDKATILAAIAGLHSGGSTAGAAGITLAYQIAADNFIEGGNNRVILATDGDFNVGISSDSQLVTLIEQKRESGIFLSVLGFGHGNLKDAKMEQLADKGNGNYHYIDDILEGRRVLVEQMGATLFTIAKDVKIQIEFNPAKVGWYRLIGYENRILAKQDFNDDKKDAGDIGAGHSVTALYEVVPAEADQVSKHREEYAYFSVQIAEGALQSDELLTVRFRYKKPDEKESQLIQQTVLDDGQAFAGATDAFRFAAAVAEFGMLLRGSQFRGEASWQHAFQAAKAAQGEDPNGHRAEFVRIAAACRDMTGAQE